MSRETMIESIANEGHINMASTSHPVEVVSTFSPGPHKQAVAKNAWEYAHVNSNNLNFNEEHTFKIGRSQGYIDSLFLEITFTGSDLTTALGGLSGFNAIDEVVFSDGQIIEKYRGHNLFQYICAMNQDNQDALAEVLEDAGGEAGVLGIGSKKVVVPLKLFGCSKCIFNDDASTNSPLYIKGLPHELEVKVTLNQESRIFSETLGAGLSSVKLRYRRWKHEGPAGLSQEPPATTYDDFMLYDGSFDKISQYGSYRTFSAGGTETYNMDSLFKKGEVTAILMQSIESAQQTARTFVGTSLPQVTFTVDNNELYKHEDDLDARVQHRQWTGAVQSIPGTGVTGAKHYMIPLSRSPLLPDTEIGVNFHSHSPLLSVTYGSTGARAIPMTLLYKALWQQTSDGFYKVKYFH